MKYLARVWQARYFWTHLALSDLRGRWRRSFFGVLWSILQPLGMTLILAVVFGRIFKSNIVQYAPFILSGMLVWDFITTTVTGGALSFVQADAYIKQHHHPLAIYPLRNTLTNIMVLAMASVALVGWVLISNPALFGWCWLAALTLFPLAALTVWPLTLLLAYIGVRFRDLPHALTLILQVFWFISPIYIQEQVFRQNGLGLLVDVNPVFHLLEIIRAPLLRGQWPSPADYAWSLSTVAVLVFLAWLVGLRAEKRVIFYL